MLKRDYLVSFVLLGILVSGCASKKVELAPPIVPVQEVNASATVVEKAIKIPAKKTKPNTVKSPKKVIIPSKTTKLTAPAIAISSSNLRAIGPNGWTVGDIVKKIKYQKMNDKEIVLQIITAGLPYKNLDYEEIKILSSYGLSYKVINAMIKVSK
jgi:hypothetical protein